MVMTEEELDTFLWFGFVGALGFPKREALVVMNYIKTHWDELETQQKSYIQANIQYPKGKGDLDEGTPYELPFKTEWETLLELAID